MVTPTEMRDQILAWLDELSDSGLEDVLDYIASAVEFWRRRDEITGKSKIAWTEFTW